MSEIVKMAIVDDHAIFRKSLAILIELFPNYKVMFDAANGQDFINQLNPENLPEVVLMDINMPVMDGYSCTAWLKKKLSANKGACIKYHGC